MERASAAFLRRPWWAVAGLVGVALWLEVAQRWHELFPGAHAVGEVVRNLAYALLGAVIFERIIVEMPARRRRRIIYEGLRQRFEVLLMPAALVCLYDQGAKELGIEINVWDRQSIAQVGARLEEVASWVFGEGRAGIVRSAKVGTTAALQDIDRQLVYLDEDVASAVAQFPRVDGITMLQLEGRDDGGITDASDVQITWEFLEGARRLLKALVDVGAYETSIFNARYVDSVADLAVPLDWVYCSASRRDQPA